MKKLDGFLEHLGRALALITIMSFLTGTIFWAAVDIVDLYTENQFTGRMRAFDVEYWKAVRGAAFIIITSSVASVVGTRMNELIVGKKEKDEK